MSVDHETLRRWLLAAGLWEHKRQRKVYRSRRERAGGVEPKSPFERACEVLGIEIIMATSP